VRRVHAQAHLRRAPTRNTAGCAPPTLARRALTPPLGFALVPRQGHNALALRPAWDAYISTIVVRLDTQVGRRGARSYPSRNTWKSAKARREWSNLVRYVLQCCGNVSRATAWARRKSLNEKSLNGKLLFLSCTGRSERCRRDGGVAGSYSYSCVLVLKKIFLGQAADFRSRLPQSTLRVLHAGRRAH
jgi:hypothetical protein